MAEQQLRTVLEGGGFFEGPRWHEGTWWVSDFYRRTVSRVTPDGAETVVVEVEGQPSGLGWLPDGSLVVVSMKDHRVLRYADGTLSTHADLTEHCGGHLNDLVVTDAGQVFVGDFGFDLMGGGDARTASLNRIDLDGTVSVAADGLQFPNGMVIPPDGGTLVVGETLGNRYTAFDLGADGALSNRRVWGAVRAGGTRRATREGVGQLVVAPDGCALDAEGHVWAADAVGGRVVRVAEGGAIVDEVAAPEGLGSSPACSAGTTAAR